MPDRLLELFLKVKHRAGELVGQVGLYLNEMDIIIRFIFFKIIYIYFKSRIMLSNTIHSPCNILMIYLFICQVFLLYI